jgi:Na+-transporting NADH:ubiquinone oxidoreductase subunit NqrC
MLILLFVVIFGLIMNSMIVASVVTNLDNAMVEDAKGDEKVKFIVTTFQIYEKYDISDSEILSLFAEKYAYYASLRTGFKILS